MILTLARRGTPISSIRSRLPGRNALVLALLVVGVLLMPVSYRAGTDQAHVHAIFQPMLDGLLGDHHHHGEATAPAAPSPFFSPAIPLASFQDGHHLPSSQADADLPHQIQMAGAGLAITAILGLALLIATLLAGSVVRSLWTAPFLLLPVTIWPEPPPPRI
jgi:hypothetical protein